MEMTNDEVGNDDEIIQKAKEDEIAKNFGAPVEASEEKHDEKPLQQDEQHEQPVNDEPQQQAAPSLEEMIAALNEENLRLRKAIDTTNGRYGNEIQKLRMQIESSQKPSGLKNLLTNLDINHPAFEDIKSDFPELGERFLNGLRKAFAEPEQVIEQKKDEAVRQNLNVSEGQDSDQFNVELAMDRLAEKHPDYENVAKFTAKQIAHGVTKIEWKNPEFGAFVESLDDDDRDVIINGKSPSDILKISRILTQFKESHSSQDAEQVEQRSTVKERIKPDLNRSILPSGRNQSSRIAMTDDEIIEAAKKAEMKKQMGY